MSKAGEGICGVICDVICGDNILLKRLDGLIILSLPVIEPNIGITTFLTISDISECNIISNWNLISRGATIEKTILLNGKNILLSGPNLLVISDLSRLKI
jgi:hypothetical protein